MAHLPKVPTGDMPRGTGIVGKAAFTMVALQVAEPQRRMLVTHDGLARDLERLRWAFFFTMVSGQDKASLGLLLTGGKAARATAMYSWGPSVGLLRSRTRRRPRSCTRRSCGPECVG
jgi:hypothetical protein